MVANDDQLHQLIEVSQRWITAQYALLDSLASARLVTRQAEAARRAQLDQLAAQLRDALLRCPRQ